MLSKSSEISVIYFDITKYEENSIEAPESQPIATVSIIFPADHNEACVLYLVYVVEDYQPGSIITASKQTKKWD